MISQRGHPNCFGVVNLPVLLAIKDPVHPCSPWSSRSSLYFKGKWLPYFWLLQTQHVNGEEKPSSVHIFLLAGKFLQSPWAANIRSCSSSKISKWQEKWHSMIGFDNHFIIPFHEFQIQSPSLSTRSPRRGCCHVEWRAQRVRKQGVVGWERINRHLMCATQVSATTGALKGLLKCSHGCLGPHWNVWESAGLSLESDSTHLVQRFEQ